MRFLVLPEVVRVADDLCERVKKITAETRAVGALDPNKKKCCRIGCVSVVAPKERGRQRETLEEKPLNQRLWRESLATSTAALHTSWPRREGRWAPEVVPGARK